MADQAGRQMVDDPQAQLLPQKQSALALRISTPQLQSAQLQDGVQVQAGLRSVIGTSLVSGLKRTDLYRRSGRRT
jgi:hypothetical protein